MTHEARMRGRWQLRNIAGQSRKTKRCLPVCLSLIFRRISRCQLTRRTQSFPGESPETFHTLERAVSRYILKAKGSGGGSVNPFPPPPDDPSFPPPFPYTHPLTTLPRPPPHTTPDSLENWSAELEFMLPPPPPPVCPQSHPHPGGWGGDSMWALSKWHCVSTEQVTISDNMWALSKWQYVSTE